MSYQESLSLSDRLRHRPRILGRKLNAMVHTRGGRVQQNPGGVSVFNRDWDNLIILDACRYDYFEKQADLPGETEAVESLACSTPEFIRANFANRTLHDTVYFGANTWYLKLRDEIDSEVYRFVDVRSEDEKILFADKAQNVVLPMALTGYVKQALPTFKDKRLIVHYLQPHHPFIGDVGQSAFSHAHSNLPKAVRAEQPHVGREDVRTAYRENLAYALDAVQELLENLPGKTVVTADHGEMLGERHTYVPTRDYGHHPGIYNEYTVEVPWHVVTKGERKETTEEPPQEATAEERDVDDQLRSLGYKV